MNKRIPNPVFSILITTRDRCYDLLYTLGKLSLLLERPDVECLICDDASRDGTFEKVNAQFPAVRILRNEHQLGLITNRNRLMQLARGQFAVSLDDDLNFLSERPLEQIAQYFEQNPKCAVVSFRIFWSKSLPESTQTSQQAGIVRSFAGGANAWRLSAWCEIRSYPEWFVFYGEEEFAAFELFHKGWQVHYLPQVLTHHRVDMKGRKKNHDYLLRQRRSLRSGWYVYILFMPWSVIPKRLSYSMWAQLKHKVAKGNITALKAMLWAGADVFANIFRLLRERRALSRSQLAQFEQLPPVTLYWKPEV